jgi:hypothetical protein
MHEGVGYANTRAVPRGRVAHEGTGERSPTWDYGERGRGELSAQAIKDTTGHERKTVWNDGPVARSIETSRRREERRRSPKWRPSVGSETP